MNIFFKYPILIFLFWTLLLQGFIFIPESYSENVVLSEKATKSNLNAKAITKAHLTKKQEHLPEKPDVLSGAAERIQKYRMAIANLSIVTSDGQPVSNAMVKIEQTQHEFLFGARHSDVIWYFLLAKKYGNHKVNPRFFQRIKKRYHVTDDMLEKCLEKFIEFANYTALPVRWDIYEPEKGNITHELYDREIEYLHKHGFKVFAHNLVWNNYTPTWISDGCDEITQAVKKRIEDFMSYYKGKFDYFVVFNEAANPYRPVFEDVRMTKCFREIGKVPFVSMPFYVSRKIDPKAKLIINECSILEHQGFPDLLKALKDTEKKPLYDIVGIQSHMHRKLWPLDRVWKFCETYASFGLPIHFTEVTVLSGTPISGENFGKETTPEGERKQADYLVKFYTLLFSHPAVAAINWHSLEDLGAWKKAPGGLLRKNMSPKPAYDALLNLIKNKWWTRFQTKTSPQGKCQFTGFLGDYEVTVQLKDKTPKLFKIKLVKNENNFYQLNIDN